MADGMTTELYDLDAIPAYGRAYDTLDELMEAWKSGADFRFVPDGPYFSVRDMELIRRMGHRVLNLYRRSDMQGGWLSFILSAHEHVEYPSSAT